HALSRSTQIELRKEYLVIRSADSARARYLTRVRDDVTSMALNSSIASCPGTCFLSLYKTCFLSQARPLLANSTNSSASMGASFSGLRRRAGSSNFFSSSSNWSESDAIEETTRPRTEVSDNVYTPPLIPGNKRRYTPSGMGRWTALTAVGPQRAYS